MLLMRSPIIRRSSSICASPGPPRLPMPPRWRSRWLQRRTRRVDKYCSRASSTWSLPSWLCARAPKISRISIVRSATATSRWRSRFLCCAGDSAWSKRTTSAWCSWTSSFSSSALPEPTKKVASGALRRAITRSTTTSPADSASKASSSSDSSNDALPPRSTPTRMARAGASPSRWRVAFNGSVRKWNRASRLVGRFGLGLEVHRPAGHDGRDRVLVDHLRDGVAQENHVLVERLDVALQLDPVDEVDRNRNVLLAQQVQEGVL